MFQSGAPKFLWPLFLCLLFILGLPLSSVAQKSKARPKILYLTHSAGFKHDVLPFSEGVLQRLGEQSGAFESIATPDCSLVNADYLKNFDGLVFYTTGELPFSAEQKEAFLRFYQHRQGLHWHPQCYRYILQMA
jgi:uncharacterized protein